MPGHPTDHAGLEMLPFDVCLRLLSSVPVGRVAFVADGEVLVLPVNHILDGEDVVFRTSHGSKLWAAESGRPVTFEADDFDERTRSGWSVLVNGKAEPVYEESEIERLDRRGLRPWTAGAELPFWVRVRALSVTGRRTAG